MEKKHTLNESISIRLPEDLRLRIESYMKKNNVEKFASLARMAIDKFISEPQTIELVPVDNSEFEQIAGEVLEEHKSLLEKLK